MTKDKLFQLMISTFFLVASSPVFLSQAFAAQSYAIANGNNATINEWSVCNLISNTTGKQIFIPTNTSTEWAQFRLHYPAGITLSACLAGKRIFLTTTMYTGNNLTSDAVADGYCASRASAAGLSGDFDAFLYLGARMPDAVLPAGKSFSTPNGILIANDKADFFNDDGGGNYIRNPINYTEYGTINPVEYVWTAFKPAGGTYTVVPNGTELCYGYKINTCSRVHIDIHNSCGTYSTYWRFDNWSYVGVNNLITAEWAGRKVSFITNTCTDSCYWVDTSTLNSCLNNVYPIYCVEQ